MTLDRTFVECSALGFQAVITTVLAVACDVLWRRRGELPAWGARGASSGSRPGNRRRPCSIA